jgi:hypothetical protein
MSLSFLCGLFGYTRQAYYKHLRRNREGSLSDTLLLERVGYYRKLMPRLGGRKLWHLLQQDGFPVSRDRLFTLLSENNLLVKRRKKYSVNNRSRLTGNPSCCSKCHSLRPPSLGISFR